MVEYLSPMWAGSSPFSTGLEIGEIEPIIYLRNLGFCNIKSLFWGKLCYYFRKRNEAANVQKMHPIDILPIDHGA